MTTGGFGYHEESIRYVSADYTTKRSWCLAVHVARCKAFALASRMDPSNGDFGGMWITDPTTIDISVFVPFDPDDPDSHGVTIGIQDLHKSDVDPSGQYPAFLTIFENPVSYAHYAIITSNGFTNESSYSSDPSKGLYIPTSKFCGNGYYKNIPYDLAHAYAANGFGDPSDITSGTISNGELTISTICGLNYSQTSSTTYTSNNSNAIIYNPTEDATYTFGYAIKDLAIECFYKTSSSSAGMLWSIIGNIFTGDLGFDDDTAYFSKFPFGFYAPWRNGFNERNGLSISDYSYLSSNDYIECDVLQDDGWSYRYKSSGLNITSVPLMLPSFLPLRSNSNSPDKLKWSSGCIGFSFASGYNNVRTFGGIDGLGNNTKGFVRDDVLRFVSIFATRTGGATYKGGELVAMNMGTPQINLEFGVLLGWDPDNQSIL